MLDIFSKRLRSSPAYDCVPYDRLSNELQSQLTGFHDDPDLFGVLVPTNRSLTIRSVDHHAALLFFALREPGRIPNYSRRHLGARGNDIIVNLIMDGVFEIELTDGEFVSGARFREAFAAGLEDSDASHKHRLEVIALKVAQTFDGVDRRGVAAHLYNFNRLPASPQWKEWFLESREVLIRLHDVICDHLGPNWTFERTPNWAVYVRGTGWMHPSQRAKLYVSPRPDELPSVVPEALEICKRFGAARLKIARTLIDLLRSDKMVIYWTTLEEARRAGTELLRRLSGTPGHRVPFTTRIEDSDVLSSGLDPPQREILVSWESPSWRGWVVERLASAISAAKGDPSLRVPAWKHALWSMHQHGIDVTNWAPSPHMWEQE